MKINLKTLLIVYTSLFICLNLIQCSTLRKIAPEHKGVDPKIEYFVKEFKELANMQGVTFKHDVSVGFKKLDYPTIGLTTYGPKDLWREIDIDPRFWEDSTELTKMSLIFHESGHAYCDRGHDWAGGTYPEFESWKKGKEPKEGGYKDGTNCPLSLMYPTILDDFCVVTHFNDYIVELYGRCDPY